jgi:hypothetical protein
VQFRQCAILQYSKTPVRNASRSDAGGPSLRSPGFEDEDENEAPHERPNRSGCEFWCRFHPRSHLWCHFQGTLRLNMNPGLKPWAMIFNRFAVNLDLSVIARNPHFDLMLPLVVHHGYRVAGDLFSIQIGLGCVR